MRSQKSTKFINIKIKTLNHSIFEIFANPSQPIFTIQGQIQQKTSVPVAAQRLLYRGISLQTTRSFSNYDIGENNIISLIANKLPSQFSQSSSLRRSQIQKINSLNKQHLKYKKHMLLQQRSGGFKMNVEQSIEVMSQNKHVIDKLLDVLNYNYAQQSMPFKLDKRKMKVGEWVDVRDLSGVWSEGQVVAMYNQYVKVHYNGWPQRMNQWIPETSQRIMPFRSHTVQQQSSLYLSPQPKYQTTLTKHMNPNFQPQIQPLINQIQTTLQNFTKLLKQLQLQDKQSHTEINDYMMLMIQNDGHSHHHFDANNSRNLSQHENEIEHQSQLMLEGNKMMMSNVLLGEGHIIGESNIDYSYQVQMDKKEQFYTPSKQIRANDNLSNKAEDDVVSKCDKDDISNKSNKSFKSKRSQGLVDTQSMKSLIIDEKKRSTSNIFFDSTQAQSVKSVKNHSKYRYLNTSNNHNNHQQYEYIIEESDSQINDRQDKDNNNENYLSFRKKQYKRKMKASQLAPLADRLGRLLVDLAPHFAMLGYQEQGINNFSENLSTFTNQGSLESKLAKAQKKVSQQQQQYQQQSQQANNNNINNNNLNNSNQQHQQHQKNRVYYSQSPYCQFQIPVMLTPNQITRLNKLLQEQKRMNHAQI